MREQYGCEPVEAAISSGSRQFWTTDFNGRYRNKVASTIKFLSLAIDFPASAGPCTCAPVRLSVPEKLADRLRVRGR